MCKWIFVGQLSWFIAKRSCGEILFFTASPTRREFDPSYAKLVKIIRYWSYD